MSKYFSDARERRKEIFCDTKKFYESNQRLIDAIKASTEEQKVFHEKDAIKLMNEGKVTDEKARIVVSKKRSLEAAKFYKDYKVCVHNFASATNPGGGVANGSSAQEEALCRCSTLFPCISTNEVRSQFHDKHRTMLREGIMDARYNDDCIYTPSVVVFKSDVDSPQLLTEDEWYMVNVISCAAPNLRSKPSNAMNPYSGDKAITMKANDLLALHMKRMRRILDIARMNNVEVMILGAFGCGAFQNSPEVVAEAMARLLPEYQQYFKVIEFAIYCPPRDLHNFDVFNRRLSFF